MDVHLLISQPNLCSHLFGLTPNLTSMALNIPINHSPILVISSIAFTETKYESAHMTQSDLAHGPTKNLSNMILTPMTQSLLIFKNIASSSSTVLTNLSQSMTPLLPHAKFWISHPFSGFLSITTYIGNQWLI